MESMYNGECIVLEHGGNNEEKSKFLHKKCNNIFYCSPHRFKRKRKKVPCPFCEDTKNTSLEQFSYKLNNVFPNEYTILSYESSENLVLRHKCGEILEKTSMYRIIRRGNKSGKPLCPRCSNKKKLSFKEVQDRVNSIDGYKLLSKKYVNIDEKIIIKHTKCNNTFSMTLHNFHTGQNRCPICVSNDNLSKLEKQMIFILEKYTMLKFEREVLIDSHRFDFIIKSLNIIIEMDGEQHFAPWRSSDEAYSMEKFESVQYRDKLKIEIAKNNGFNIIRIPYNLTFLTIKENILNLLNDIDSDYMISSTTIENLNRFIYINFENNVICNDNYNYLM